MSLGPVVASSLLVATALGVVVVVLDVCGVVVVVAGAEGAVPVPLVLVPELGVVVVPVLVPLLFVVELVVSGLVLSVFSELFDLFESVVGLVSVVSVSFAVSSALFGVRQNKSHKTNQIKPITSRAETISQITRPTVDGCLCSYICLASRVSYV